jgi:hypothetical protein
MASEQRAERARAVALPMPFTLPSGWCFAIRAT